MGADLKIDLTPVGLMKAAGRGALFLFVLSIVAVYILDMIFFGSIGDGWFLTIVFVLVGITFRTGAVVLDVYLHYTKKAMGHTSAFRKVRAIWWFCIIVCLISAINFFAAGHAAKEAEGGIGEAVATTQLTSKATRISREEAKIARIERDRDAAINDINTQIEMIRNDGVPGISAADNASIAKLNEDARTYRDAATAQITEIELEISRIQDEAAVVAVDQTLAEQRSDTWEVFVWLGDHTPLSVSTWSNSGLFFMAMLLEAIAAFGLGAYVALQNTFRKVLAEMEVEESIRSIEHGAELDAARIRAEALKSQLMEKARADTRSDVEAGGAEQTEPSERPKPKPNERENWNDAQWRALHGFSAREFYKKIGKKLKLRIPAVLRVDDQQAREAAE